MSNLETEPGVVEADCTAGPGSEILVLEPRVVPLGGPRAMTVFRTLPQRARSTIGGWCFVDHYGPDDVSLTGGMQVPPHPHIGLQTVSWLFRGEIEHRDSIGSHAYVRPGELNLMTAGRGISHAEYSTANTTVLHGAQLWLVLPDASRWVAPSFENTAPAPFTIAAAIEGCPAPVRAQVFIGALVDHPDHAASAAVHSPLLGAELTLPAGAELDLALDPSFEHGVLVDLGQVQLDSSWLARRELGYLGAGRRSIRITADAAEGARILLLGGEPLGEQIIMWWNFVGRSNDEIVIARADWMAEIAAGSPADGRFGSVDDSAASLPAPVLPNVRLKPREQ